jgi:hypothetical protein
LPVISTMMDGPTSMSQLSGRIACTETTAMVPPMSPKRRRYARQLVHWRDLGRCDGDGRLTICSRLRPLICRSSGTDTTSPFCNFRGVPLCADRATPW